MPLAKLFRISILMLLPVLIATACNDQRVEVPVDEVAPLQGKTVGFLITEGFHDAETLFPMGYLINHGAEVVMLGIERGNYTAYNSDVTLRVERTVTEVSPGDFDALVIPGGRSPAGLRENEDVVTFVRTFVEDGKPAAAICHGPQVLVSAGVVSGMTLTGVGGIQDEITGAGATFEDVEVMVDGNIITSRLPGDLPAFSREIAQALIN